MYNVYIYRNTNSDDFHEKSFPPTQRHTALYIDLLLRLSTIQLILSLRYRFDYDHYVVQFIIYVFMFIYAYYNNYYHRS